MAYFNPFTGILPSDSAAPSIFDVQRRQALAQKLGATPYVQNSGPLGALAQALGGIGSSFESGAAANEAQLGQTQAIQGLQSAMNGGWNAYQNNPGALVGAMASPFLPESAGQTANNWLNYQNQLHTPVPVTSFTSGFATPADFMPGGDPSQGYHPLYSSSPDRPLNGPDPNDPIGNIAGSIMGLPGYGKMDPEVWKNLPQSQRTPVLNILSAHGFDAQAAGLNQLGAEKQVSSQNGITMDQVRSANTTVQQSLDLIDNYADQWAKLGLGQTNFPALNQATIDAAINGSLGILDPQKAQQAQQIALQLKREIAIMTPEVARVFTGKSPTDASLAEAGQVLSAAFSNAITRQGTEQLRLNMQRRMSALNQTASPVGSGPVASGPPPTPNVGSPAPVVGAPTIGTLDGGYRYMGGDPSQQSSWQKVQ